VRDKQNQSVLAANLEGRWERPLPQKGVQRATQKKKKLNTGYGLDCTAQRKGERTSQGKLERLGFGVKQLGKRQNGRKK